MYGETIIPWTGSHALASLVVSFSMASNLPSFAADVSPVPAPWAAPVPKAKYGPGSRAESGLQGATSLAERFGGASAQGFRCNMELVGQW